MSTAKSSFSARPTEVSSLSTPKGITDINTISAFLSSPTQPFDFDDLANTVYVLIGSAILPTLEATFQHISLCQQPVTLLLAGGIGHSTSLLYAAVSRHHRYSSIYEQIRGLPEAQVYKLILLRFWPPLKSMLGDGRLRLLIDDRSTNCGANAIESKKELEKEGMSPSRLVIIQDPTMHRRTLATFAKAFQDDIQDKAMTLVPWSFYPELRLSEDGSLTWKIEGGNVDQVETSHLWEPDRFISLVMGEIPRIRDDKNGYGPKGAGYIAHVDIPEEVEKAWQRLDKLISQRV
ncbi:uncharacterized protein I303_106340 [Kwoniella dejecticola CBS 10117]|uniref:DUF218 domain-containing protein n=1 Tax=Kwoniella dejecticola CBS 10117 TaxID=1296121 RepID=A0A1A5ZUZ6_9TREE|nr:uncharacterized protein I303_08403 [Kwoniella dejecticola CBS 10117]OBR81632.1 hypothetical protein I303_08403 [Kwoniella dejecticola CBS 10117]